MTHDFDTQDLDIRIGRRLRACRLRADLSIEALAERVGLQPSTITRYESGGLHIPVRQLTSLADLLRVPLRAFFA